ncbi:hypothetical protein JL720_1373 [Aureococcus anophagefferens]|nr:hypothetical protein JL720_1373 [Aureococcus anophagefferens]
MRLLLAPLGACLAAAADTNHTVYIIRHGEKTWSGGCLRSSTARLQRRQRRAAAAIKEARAETVTLVAWEHENIQYLAADLGVPTKSIPDWKSDDYDSVYELTFDAAGAFAGFDALAQDYKPCSSDSKYKPCSKGAAVESRYA